MPLDIDERATAILQALARDPLLASYIDPSHDIPKVYCGIGTIRLIILGQDPTVDDPAGRAKVKQVLKVKQRGPLHNYIQRICLDLQFDLCRNIYATNFVKNFFTRKPTQVKEVDLLAEASFYWLPLLRDELAQFPGIPVITLGEPLLSHIVIGGASPLVHDYWGYLADHPGQSSKEWHFLRPDQNLLGRVVFPFPHLPSLQKDLYRDHLRDYLAYMRRELAWLNDND